MYHLKFVECVARWPLPCTLCCAYGNVSQSVNNAMCKNALWSPAVGVLSLVAKYASRSVSQPSIHVYPELYVKNLHTKNLQVYIFVHQQLFISDRYPCLR